VEEAAMNAVLVDSPIRRNFMDLRSRFVSSSLFRAFAGLALVIFVLAVAGCGGSGAAGTYVAEDKSPDGESMKITLELKSGGKAAVTISGGPDGESLPTVEGTWTQEGDKNTTVLDGDKDVYTLKDGTLTMNFFGEMITLKKK
jgi:hypothetical protein